MGPLAIQAGTVLVTQVAPVAIRYVGEKIAYALLDKIAELAKQKIGEGFDAGKNYFFPEKPKVEQLVPVAAAAA